MGELNKEKALVDLFSILGKRVYSTQTTTNTLKIDASKLDKGVYLLKVVTKTANKSFKIIKN